MQLATRIVHKQNWSLTDELCKRVATKRNASVVSGERNPQNGSLSDELSKSVATNANVSMATCERIVTNKLKYAPMQHAQMQHSERAID